MITKEQLLALLEGNLEIVSEQLSEKAETVTTDIAGYIGEAMLTEMTPGHKEMVKQHLDAVDVVDYDADGSGKAKAKATKDARIKNPKRPDERDEYNELGDFETNKGKGPKADKTPNFGAKTYTDERKKQRKIDEAVEPLMELSKKTLGRYINSASDSQRSNAVVAHDKYGAAAKHYLKKTDNDNEYAKYLDKQGDGYFNKSVKRRKGIQTAVKKLTKEEVEPLMVLESWFKKRSQPITDMNKKEIKKPDWKLKYKQPGEKDEDFKKRMMKESVESLDEAGFSAPLGPLVKSGKKDSGYMRHGKGYAFNSSNPDMRINRRAGIDKKIGWDDDAEKEMKHQKNQENRIKRRMTKEEIEPLMELSRSTLARYVHKSGHDQIRNYEKASRGQDNYHKNKDRNRLDWAQGKKSDKERDAQADELDSNFVAADKKITRTMNNRTKGIGRALTRLAKD